MVDGAAFSITCTKSQSHHFWAGCFLAIRAYHNDQAAAPPPPAAQLVPVGLAPPPHPASGHGGQLQPLVQLVPVGLPPAPPPSQLPLPTPDTHTHLQPGTKASSSHLCSWALYASSGWFQPRREMLPPRRATRTRSPGGGEGRERGSIDWGPHKRSFEGRREAGGAEEKREVVVVITSHATLKGRDETNPGSTDGTKKRRREGKQGRKR